MLNLLDSYFRENQQYIWNKPFAKRLAELVQSIQNEEENVKQDSLLRADNRLIFSPVKKVKAVNILWKGTLDSISSNNRDSIARLGSLLEKLTPQILSFLNCK